MSRIFFDRTVVNLTKLHINKQILHSKLINFKFRSLAKVEPYLKCRSSKIITIRREDVKTNNWRGVIKLSRRLQINTILLFNDFSDFRPFTSHIFCI